MLSAGGAACCGRGARPVLFHVSEQLPAGVADGSACGATAWFPRLREATPEQREDLRLIGGGIGIHWPQLDEDLSIRGLLFPHPEGAQRVGSGRGCRRGRGG